MVVRRGGFLGFEPGPEGPRRRHGVDGARDDLLGPGPRRLVGAPRLEQFGVGENDPELIVQSMEEFDHCRRTRHRHAQASDATGIRRAPGTGLRASSGGRHKVSTKILTEPPAVRTYSTLPPAIQL